MGERDERGGALAERDERGGALAGAAERIARLQAVAAALTRARTAAQVGAALVEHGLPGTGASGLALAWVCGPRRLKLLHQSGPALVPTDEAGTFAAEDGRPVATAFRTRQPVWLGSPEAVAAASRSSPPPRCAAQAALPLFVDGKPAGALGLSFAAPRVFDAVERAFLQSLAEQCTQALERTRLHEQAQLERSRAEALASVAVHLNAGRTLPDVMAAALQSTAGLLGAHDGALFFVEPDGRHLRGALELWRGDRTGAVLALEDLPNTLAAITARRSRYFVLAEAGGAEPEWFERLDIDAALVAPLMMNERCLGVLYWNYHAGSDPPAPDDLAFADALAAQAALALDRAAAHEQRLKALEREKASAEARYRRMVETTLEGVVIADPEGRIVFVNPGAAELLGYGIDELVGASSHLVLDDDEIAAIPGRRARFRGGARERVELRLRRRDGTFVDVLAGLTPIVEDGAYRGVLAMVTDITARKQAERALVQAHERLAVTLADERRARQAEQRLTRALRALSRGNEVLVRATAEAELLAEICRVVVDVAGYRMAWVGLCEHDATKSVRVAAHAGYEAGYLATVNVTWADTARGHGPTGTAIRTRAPAINRDLAADAEFAPWREAALARGYASVLGLPLLAGGEGVGALTIYAPDPEAFDDDEVALLRQLADDLAFGMAALRRAR